PNAVTAITYPGRTDTYAYDDAGQLAARTVDNKQATFTWNPLGQATIQGADTAMVYDAAGKRLIRRDPGGTTLYLGPVELRLASGQITGKRYYSSSDGSLVALREPSGVTWMLAGLHGSTQLAVNATTGNVSRERYLPFGERRGSDDLPFTDRGFLGKTEDASTGLTYLGARYYDPTIAKFISTDPELDLRTPEWANPYSYAANNPIDQSDPDGRRVDAGGGSSDKSYGYSRDKNRPNANQNLAKTHHASGKKKTARERKIHKKRIKANEKNRRNRIREQARDAQISDKKGGEEEFRRRQQRTDKATLCKRDPVYCGRGTVQENDDVALITGFIGGVGGVIKSALTRGLSTVGKAAVPRPKPDPKWFPDRKLPRDKHGNPQPESRYPHTQLGRKQGRRENYPQARKFGDNGEVMKDYDFTDHGRPDVPGHENPHQHRYEDNPTGGNKKRGPAEPWTW
ncbi:RHS repeat-associated core domain-containing protein, partial [Nonomuraea sp. NPDC050478]|uniref:RHS repeat-associated core domain-containing protein n=1 Tax=Nonomuraea sp. NPDC050478 TaxID=3364365 RepID=UPI003799672F